MTLRADRVVAIDGALDEVRRALMSGARTVQIWMNDGDAVIRERAPGQREKDTTVFGMTDKEGR